MGFTVRDSKNCVEYVKCNLTLELHFDSNYLDKHMYIVINSKFGRHNLFDSNIFNNSERTRYNKELEHMEILFDLQQHFVFYSNIIKNKLDDLLKLT
jgi:hypothetical protein